MTRIPSFAAWTVLACATVFAASRAETTTYVDGNLTGVSPNTGGTLLFSDDNTLVFRTGLTTVSIPYTAVTRSELGATRETSHGGKFSLKKKKTETQFLTVEFKNDEGDAKTMTLELAQASAGSTLAAIQEHTGKTETAEVAVLKPGAQKEIKSVPVAVAPASSPAPAHVTTASSSKPIINPNDRGSKASPATKPGSDWWGDDVWKTTRNSSGWTKPTGTNAPQE